MTKYLEVNQEDMEGWQEAADIYMSMQNYAKASFCYEEMLLREPKNYLVNLRYAELLYSAQSRPDRQTDLVNARKYFAHAAVMKEGQADARTLFGLLKTCQALDKINKKEEVKNTEMIEVTKANILELYARNSTIDVSKMASL